MGWGGDRGGKIQATYFNDFSDISDFIAASLKA
jgi:hypothetical protein